MKISRSFHHLFLFLLLFLSLFLSPLLTGAGGSNLEDAVRAMVAAERKFYQTGQEKGTRAAFLAFLADDGIVFHPGPVNGKEAWQKQAETGLDLIWEPTFAAIARSADFGYTTGPAHWKTKKEDPKPTGYGQFVSVWKKQKDGAWKVALDLGIENPEPAGKTESLRTFVPDNPDARADLDARREALDEAERKFAAAARTNFADALIGIATDEIRVYRDGSFPAVGKNAATTLLAGKASQMSFESIGGDVSRSADLAYRYGKYSSTRGDETESGHFLQIWQTDATGAWKLVLEWEQPLPKQKS